jgi:hypothetical protein
MERLLPQVVRWLVVLPLRRTKGRFVKYHLYHRIFALRRFKIFSL